MERPLEHSAGSPAQAGRERGVTLVETLIALGILVFGLLAIAHTMAFSLVASKSYGRDGTKATAYARDKMAELATLRFADTTTNLTVAAPFPANGVGLAAGGAIPPSSPVAGYVDYLDTAGIRTTAENAVFTRQWQIVDESATLKRVVVVVRSNRSFRFGTAPSTTTVTYLAP